MRMIRQAAKHVSVVLTLCILLTSVPCRFALASMIGTEMVLETARGLEARGYLNRVLAREDIQTALMAQGIDPLEAKSRVDSLSDAEAIGLADHIELLPAGGNAAGAIVGALLIVFLVLLITDILGYTDIFPFVAKHHDKK